MSQPEGSVEKYEVLLRYRCIELIAYWEGRLNTPRLIELFGISRQQASKDIRLYIEKYNPSSLVYDNDIRAYRPVDGFTPKLSVGHINEYMECLTGIMSQSRPMNAMSHSHIASVNYPNRSVEAAVVRRLLLASRKAQAVSVSYVSMNNPVSTRRVISPHTLIYTGFRWHIRAFCHKREGYRDFIISRMTQVSITNEVDFIDNLKDTLWQENIKFYLVPNPLLDKHQQQVIKKDFAMYRGRLAITTQKALVHYTLQRYQAATNTSEHNLPYTFPLVVESSSLTKIQPYLFSSA